MQDIHISRERLQWFLDVIYNPLLQSKNLVIRSVPGSGVKSLIKTVGEEFRGVAEKTVPIVIVLSVNDAISTDGRVTLRIKNLIETKHGVSIDIQKVGSVYDLLIQLLLRHEISIILVLYDIVDSGDYSKGNEASFLKGLKNARSDRITFAFIQNFEAEDIILPPEIICDVVYFPFADELSVMQSIKQYEALYNKKIPKDVKERVWLYSQGDGRLTKQLSLLVCNNVVFAGRFTQLSVEEVYQAIGEQYLDMRFEQIIEALRPESIQWLLDRQGNVSEYIAKTGLANKKIYSPLFEYYLEHRRERVHEAIRLKRSDSPLLKLLTGKEYELYRYLKEHPGLNNKNNIGFALWSSKSGEKFSLWTLDKIISNLRKKLVSHRTLGRILATRNKGVQLVPFE